MADENVATEGTPLGSKHFAEPPYVRDRLIKEIKFFISHLKSRTGGGGVSTVSSRDSLIDYVTCASEAEIKGAGLASGRSSAGGSLPHSTISSRYSHVQYWTLITMANGQYSEDLEFKPSKVLYSCWYLCKRKLEKIRDPFWCRLLDTRTFWLEI
jgi:hypothetical protein